MIVAYQVLLMIVTVVGVIGVLGERENEKIRMAMLIITVTSIISFLVSTKWFG